MTNSWNTAQLSKHRCQNRSRKWATWNWKHLDQGSFKTTARRFELG